MTKALMPVLALDLLELTPPPVTPRARALQYSIPVMRIRAVKETQATYADSIPAAITLDNSEKIFRPLFDDCHAEEFWVACLSSSHKVKALFCMARGGVDQAAVYPAECVKAALLANASAVIVAHNHPSGEGHASMQDKQLTRALQDAFRTVNIRLLDHIIITEENCFSFRKEGLL
jgi:DNA repair protein RadC